MSSASPSPCPIEELLVDDPVALPRSETKKNSIDQGELVGAEAGSSSSSHKIVDQQPEIVTHNEDEQEAILVDEEANKCYTCHQEFVSGSPVPALVVNVQQNESSKLTIQVCLACYRRLDYDYSSGESHQQFSGCPILPESKIIVNAPNISHKCFRCFETLPDRSVHPVSLQDGILNASCPAVLQESGYEFAVYLCNSCAHWKKFSGKMREVTTLKFPATRTLFLPPISNVQQSNSSKDGSKSINYPVSMLVNKARSLMERFKDESSLSAPPTIITDCMMYIHTTKYKSSPSTHWSCDGFAFQKTSTRVVRIQESDHVIRETNWVTAGPGDPEIKFKRRTITSSEMKDITLVHYLGKLCEGIRTSREVNVEDEYADSSVKQQNYHLEGPEFFTNNFYFKLLTSVLPQGNLRQDYKLMPLATKYMFWTGGKWFSRTDSANVAVMTEVVRLVVDCKLSPEAVAEGFYGVTPELIRAHIKQLKSLYINNIEDSKYKSWLSFVGPWLVQKDPCCPVLEGACSHKRIPVVQYLRVPVATNGKYLLKCYINDPGRLQKVLKGEDTGIPQDKEVQLIQTLAKALIKQDKKIQKLKTPRLSFANPSTSNLEYNPDDPDAVDAPDPVKFDVHSTSSTNCASSGDILMPTISSVVGSVGGVTVMGSPSPAQLPMLETTTAQLTSKNAAQYQTNLIDRVSREVDLEAKVIVKQDQNVQKPKTPSPLFANYPTSNFEDKPDAIDVPVISDVHSTSSTDYASSGDTLLPTISSVVGSVGGVTVMGSPSPPLLPRKEGPSTQTLSKIAAQYITSQFIRPSSQVAPQIKTIYSPVQPRAKSISNPGKHVQFAVLPTQPLPVSATQTPPKTAFQTLAPRVVVSGNKIILPPNFIASGARLVQIPSSDGTKRLVLINSSQQMTKSKNTPTETTNVVNSIPKSIIVHPQTCSLLPSPTQSIPQIEDSISSRNVATKDEPETAVDPLEIDSRNIHPANRKSAPQTKMNHLVRTASVQANICAEIAEECIFNKSFSDVLIYGTTSSEQKNPLSTHSLLLAAISPNLKQLLQKAERNGEGVYELVIPGVALQEIEALMEEVIGTLLMPPNDDNSVTFTMSKSLWSLFAGVRPEEAKLGKNYIQNKPVVPNSFSARIKSMESLTDHWAKQSVCDEQTGQMVIQMGTKRKIEESSTAQGSPNNIKTSADISRKCIKLSNWSKQVGSVNQKNIQEKDSIIPCTEKNTVDRDDDYEVIINSGKGDSLPMRLSFKSSSMINRNYNIYKDKLPIKAVRVAIKNLHHMDQNTAVYSNNWKEPKKVDELYPHCRSPAKSDFDLLTYEDDPLDNDYVPRGKMKTSSNIKGSMMKKKSPDKWIFNQ